MVCMLINQTEKELTVLTAQLSTDKGRFVSSLIFYMDRCSTAFIQPIEVFAVYAVFVLFCLLHFTLIYPR